MKATPLPPATCTAILAAARDLVAIGDGAGLGVGDVAKAAGVSRQSVYLGFGSREGLIAGLCQLIWRESGAPVEMRAAADAAGDDPAALDTFMRASLGVAPALAAPAAMISGAGLHAFETERLDLNRRLFDNMRRAGRLSPLFTPAQAADLAWSLTHVDRYRHLVVQCGWPENLYTEETITLAERTLTEVG